ncbi:MAG: hypothetical protein K6T85_16530 [Gorillibacterium sp.]|nr:hypothetical protein [Gorillibacterium sp.]
MKKPILQIPSMPTMEWHKVFNFQTAPLADSIRNAQYVEDALAAIRVIKPPLTPLLEQLFRLHTYLFVCKKLTNKSQPGFYTHENYMGYFTRTAISDLHEKIDKCLATKLLLSDEPEQWTRVTETLTYIRQEMLTEPSADCFYLTHYDQLWKNWIHPNLNDNQPYVEELQQLKSAQAEPNHTLSRFPWKVAQSSMHFYLREDQEAWMLLKEANSLSDHYYDVATRYLHDLSASSEWSRLVTWLIEIGPSLTNYRSKRMNEYSAFWNRVLEQIPDAELLMWDTLVRMLPYSSMIYEDQLLLRGKWELWIDYQLTIGNEPLSFRVSVLRPLEKEAPETLLPFYHQAVERYVLQKNRTSYRSAVKLLKRLAKLYKKMKQEDRWALFFSAFIARHSRLRALHEELRKGKLLS